MEFATATTADVTPVLGLLDRTVEWLVANGRPGQWGSKPWSSRPATVEQITERIERGEAVLALDNNELAGVIFLTTQLPATVPSIAEPELYIYTIAADPHRRGQGVGAALLTYAKQEAIRTGAKILRVGAYVGAGDALAAYYRSQGFEDLEPLTVGREGGPIWQGMLMGCRVNDHVPAT